MYKQASAPTGDTFEEGPFLGGGAHALQEKNLGSVSATLRWERLFLQILESCSLDPLV